MIIMNIRTLLLASVCVCVCVCACVCLCVCVGGGGLSVGLSKEEILAAADN